MRSALSRAIAVAAIACAGLAALPSPAHAWWRGGVVVGVVPFYAPPPAYYAPPPVYYAPPPAYYAPPPAYGRSWVPGHWGPWGWIPGHWR